MSEEPVSTAEVRKKMRVVFIDGKQYKVDEVLYVWPKFPYFRVRYHDPEAGRLRGALFEYPTGEYHGP